ncbi:hypothetical protein [Prauserella endophytica]|uniref:TnpV protein n=1 Tax=Prauserella endophytica TaxID=1592324 RepID=A0ABY2RUX8_9PSEU|nr:hypothetical protein [Prauserella endophytica]TKG61546.1 hypothetical protein FCN18_33445 [Prauserella endophytica]
MNQYAAMARSHWQRFLPSRYSAITDPDSFFSTLGQEVETEIDQLTEQLAGEDPPNEDYLGKVGRLNAARQQAREKVLAERVLLPAEPGSLMDEDSTEANPTPAGERNTDWIPMTEDPTNLWWQEQDSSSP